MRTPALDTWRIAGLALVVALGGCSKDNTTGNKTGGNTQTNTGGSNSGGGTTNSTGGGSTGSGNGGAKSGGGISSSTGGTSGGTSGSSSSGGVTSPGGATSAGGAMATCTGVDLQTDPKNCGKCGTVCASNTCNAGVCKKVKACFTKTTMIDPVIATFDTYDGTTSIDKYGWAMNALPGSLNAVYAGIYHYNDGTGTPKMSLLAPGHADSKFTANIQNTEDKGWGGAFGIWMSCVDASAYQGLSFWVKGTLPLGKGSFSLSMESTSAPDKDDPAGGGTCTTEPCKNPTIDFPVTDTWTQVLVKWDGLIPGTGNGTPVIPNGKDITGFSWTAGAKYVSAGGDAGWVPGPGSYDLSVDNIQFIGTTACPEGQTICATGCIDTKASNDHCGTCGNACVNSRTCQAGACVCPAGYVDCNGECVNTKIDAQHCGGCGKACTGVCSDSACTASICKANMPAENKTSTAAASITLGKYWINNNQWGQSGASGSQSVWSTCSSGNTIGWGTEWASWTGSASQVKSYASAVLGWHWGWKLTGGGLPVQLSAVKNITCGWTYRVVTSQAINVSFDLFAHNTSTPGTNDDPTDEIMIWLYRSNGAAPIGPTVTTVNIGGTSWELHQGSNGRWMVHSYVRASNADTGSTLNLGDFLKDLTTNRGLSGSKHLNSIQAGTEVYLGTGRLDTDQYYCTIQ